MQGCVRKRSEEDPFPYIFLYGEISALYFIINAILIFLFKISMIGLWTGPPAMKIAQEGFQVQGYSIY
jgi:hypothetical protein